MCVRLAHPSPRRLLSLWNGAFTRESIVSVLFFFYHLAKAVCATRSRVSIWTYNRLHQHVPCQVVSTSSMFTFSNWTFVSYKMAPRLPVTRIPRIDINRRTNIRDTNRFDSGLVVIILSVPLLFSISAVNFIIFEKVIARSLRFSAQIPLNCAVSLPIVISAVI